MGADTKKLSTINRELELIALQLRHATVINYDPERIKVGLNKLDIQLADLKKLEKTYNKQVKS